MQSKSSEKENNIASYESSDVLRMYKAQTKLQGAEAAIFKAFDNEIKKAHLLDIGIGTGRTSNHLIPTCKKYMGVDYSAAMIEYCKGYFKDENADFSVCDARNMTQFIDNTFDVVLFSFNGIDCVPKDDRALILNEIKRVAKPDALFIFSAHNTQTLRRLYKFRMPRNPFNFLKERERWQTLRRLNGQMSDYEGKDYFRVRDGADYFKTEVLYINPKLQIKELQDLGFSDINLYDRSTGIKLIIDQLENHDEPWIYYTARVKKQI